MELLEDFDTKVNGDSQINKYMNTFRYTKQGNSSTFNQY